jgi:hypothetical protein
MEWGHTKTAGIFRETKHRIVLRNLGMYHELSRIQYIPSLMIPDSLLGESTCQCFIGTNSGGGHDSLLSVYNLVGTADSGRKNPMTRPKTKLRKRYKGFINDLSGKDVVMTKVPKIEVELGGGDWR